MFIWLLPSQQHKSRCVSVCVCARTRVCVCDTYVNNNARTFVEEAA